MGDVILQPFSVGSQSVASFSEDREHSEHQDVQGWITSDSEARHDRSHGQREYRSQDGVYHQVSRHEPFEHSL